MAQVELETVGIVVTAATLALSIFAQVREQRRAREEQVLAREEAGRAREVHAFELYQRVSTMFSEAVMFETTDRDLAEVWVDLPAARREELDALHRADMLSGVWNALEPDEQMQYRYTRRVFDVLEQASEAHRRELLGADDQMWTKWEGYLEAWLGTRWAPYVVDLAREAERPRFHPEFVRLVAAVRSEHGGLRAVPTDAS